MKRLFKTLIAGIIFGVFGAGASIYYFPVVDLHRERSVVSVQPNGGNQESFRINLPADRIMVGLAGVADSIPAGLDWPDKDFLGDMQAEIFIIRDVNNAVVGVASRLASASEESGSFIEWVLHFPARGTVYAEMELTPAADGFRNGEVRTGTRDFQKLTGSVREQFVPGTDDGELQARIALQMALVGPLGEET